MLLIQSDNTDVYFNLAAEDHLLHTFKEDILMLWRSRKAVVCGKHQNVCAEVNYGYCRENGIDVARRLSGGGTVFHDPGNINFTFIQTIPEGLEHAVNYRRFLEPMRAALQSMGVETTYSDRNDLLVNGKKISGNAEHVLQRQHRVLHHGTLLFQSDLDALGEALHTTGTYKDKAVKSVRSEVTNISTHYPRLQEADDFLARLFEYFLSEKHTYRYVFNAADIYSIENQRNTKYNTEAWILGYSPAYQMERELQIDNVNYRIAMSTQNGAITSLTFSNDQNETCFSKATQKMVGKPLTENNVTAFFEELNISEKNDAIIYSLF